MTVSGGRNAELKVGEFSFDTGPIFLHQKFTLDEVFAEAGRKTEDYMDLLECDDVVVNADYAHAISTMMNGHSVPREKLEKKNYSCSTFVLYLGLDKIYRDEPHHHILFADNYLKLDQMLYLRPQNRMKSFDNLYLVGGGTHPGSGLPTIYESGRISSNLLCESYGMECARVDMAPSFL